MIGEALRVAGTTVCEPVDRLRVEFPSDSISEVLKVLGRHGAVPESTTTTVVEALLRTGSVDAVRHELVGAAHGLAVVDAQLSHYAPLRLG